MPFKKISDEQHQSFLSALRAGQYNLLLGAGASMDSKDQQNKKLPSGSQFKKEICELKGVSEDYPLQRVYSLLDEKDIEQHVTNRFSLTKPGPTAELIRSFLWKRIFTLNVDDVLEIAYEDQNAMQQISSIHFKEAYYDADSNDELHLVHLHGSVKKPEKGYVFSTTEYMKTLDEHMPWTVVLTQLMQSSPVIIAGTALNEPDLDFYLTKRTTETSRDDRGPSILVEEEDDKMTVELCNHHNLLHFVGYSSDFFSYCEKALPTRPTTLELMPDELRELVPAGVDKPAALAFESDFELVHADAQGSDEATRFLYGHPPTWEDLASNNDVPRSTSSDLIRRVESKFSENNMDRLIIFSEHPGNGKTTILRRVGYEMAQRGAKVLLHTPNGRLGRATASIIDLIDDPLLILVDDFAEHASYVADLLLDIQKDDVVVLATERSYRWRYLENALSEIKYDKITKCPLRDSDIVGLIERYNSHGLVADGQIIKNPQRFSRSVVNDQIAITCCRILNDFKPIERIVVDLIEDTNEQDLDRYIVASIARKAFSGGVRYEILNDSVRSTGMREQLEGSHPLPLKFSDPGHAFVVPENVTLSELILDEISSTQSDRLLKGFVSLANSIRPWVNRTAIRLRAPEARLTGRLFDYDDVVRKMLREKSNTFYDKTRAKWQWNSRYWEQIALMNKAKYTDDPENSSSMEYLLAAVRHARHAVSVETHPHTLTTLGQILLTQATAVAKNQEEILSEAIESLARAIELERKWLRSAPQPYYSLFNGLVRFIEGGGKLTSKQLDLVQENIKYAEIRFPPYHDLHNPMRELESKLGK